GGRGFAPVGTTAAEFTGNLNGNGYVIDGLTINRPDQNEVGLFGHTFGASITAVGLTQVAIIGNGHVGSLVGESSLSSIDSSYATGAVTATGGNNAGGLVGLNVATSTIDNSYAVVEVTGNNNTGGLVGANNISSHISNSYASGGVTGNDRVGGL